MSSSTPAAPYPGNPSLPAEVREKILTTFRHALTLFSAGNVNDCLIGCEFILKMDPRFTPARRLQEKVRNRDSEVDISELLAAANSGGAPAPSAAGTASPPPAHPPAPPPPAAPRAAPRMTGTDPQRVLAEAGMRLEEGDYDGAIASATTVLTLLPGNKDALAIIEKAAGRKATKPLLEASRVRASQALDDGHLSEARLEIERMRAMDPEHPAIALLQRRLNEAAPPEPAPAPAPAVPASLPDFSLDPQGLDPFGFGSPGRPPESHESFVGLSPSSEPAGLDPMSARPSGSELFSSEAPAEEAPPHSASDLFLSVEAPGPAIPDLPGEPPPFNEEEEVRASEREIASLLKQGDETAARGERQQAIEIWSRVFLIDINNSEAVTRIEKTRQEMADQGRQMADCLKKGRESFEAGDREAARAFFLQAQSLDPNDATARLYLERLDQGAAEPARPSAPPEGARKSAPPARTQDALLEEPALAPIGAEPPAARRAGLPINARVLAVIGAFLAMTLVGVYFFVFKGTKSHEPPPRVVSAGSVSRARDFLGKGKVAEARAELRRIGPTDADYDDAQRLLGDLGKSAGSDALAGKGAAPAPAAGGPPREKNGENDPARLRAAAEKALDEKRYIDALKNFNLAAPAFRDDPDFAQKQGLASDKVTALTPAVKFYNEGEYDTAIPILWRILQEDRGNQDARSYLLRAYYNQGITQLQNGLYPKAAQAFQEALALDPNDAEAVRHKKFAERYQRGDLDLMGRIYVRHLNHRP